MTNKARGEVALDIDGQRVVFLCTVGAMAEIETELDLDFDGLLKKFDGTVSMRVVLACAEALARGGGLEDVSIIRRSTDILGICSAVGEAMSAGMPKAKKDDGAKAT